MKKINKQKQYLSIVLTTVLTFSACQKDAANLEEEKHNTPGIQQELDNHGIPTGKLPAENKDGGNIESDEKGEETQQNPQESEKASQKITDGEVTKKKSEHPITLKDGKVWGELFVVGEEDTVYCNRQENIKETENLLLLCPDPRYGMTYYVNHGLDYYIYAIKDGVSELVLEIPAKRLFFRQGKLYFMVEDYDKYVLDGLENGDILSYNPVDGKVSVVLSGIGTVMTPQAESVILDGDMVEVPEEVAVDGTSMTVYQDGIYYVQVGESLRRNGKYIWDAENKYYYSFETGKTQLLEDTSPVSSLTFVRWGQSLVVWESENYEGKDIGMMYDARTGRMLVDSQMQKERSLGFACDPYFYLVGDKAYTTQVQGLEPNEYGYSYANATTEIIAYDMKTGEENRYPVSWGESVYTSAFFMFDNTAYFKDLISYSITEEKEHLVYCNLIAPNNLKASVVSEYYTDGKGLFALCELDGRMYRIERKDEPYTLSLPIGDIVYDYRFDFIPIGE